MVRLGSMLRSPQSRLQRKPFPLVFVAGLTVIALVLVYVGLTNDVATQGYRLNDLQQRIASLEAQQSSLQLELAAVQSLQRVESETPALALTPLSHVEYLTPLTTAVAVR